MTTKLRVLIADDHQLVRQSLCSILEEEPDLELVGGAGSGRESIEQTAALSPDIVIMDVAMPDLNGIEATRRIKKQSPETRIVALSSHSDRRYVIAILQAGADAYVLKAGAYEELCRAVRAVRDGKRYLCPEVAGIVVDENLGTGAGGKVTADDGSPFTVLAPREREVLQLIAEGLSTAEVAGRLHLSPHTVVTHRRNLMRKVGLHNVADLTRYAIREGLASPHD